MGCSSFPIWMTFLHAAGTLANSAPTLASYHHTISSSCILAVQKYLRNKRASTNSIIKMSDPATNPVIYTKDADYLDEDQPIRGQNYVCLSFISPEDLLANKEVFYFEHYMRNAAKDIATLLDGLTQKYPNDVQLIQTIRDNHRHFFKEEEMQDDYRTFKALHANDIEKDFAAKNNFRTSVRGIKVRGVYDTVAEAQNRAQQLKRQGDKFDIFVAQVGCWCPWNPNPETVQNVEYDEAQLNTLMKQYQDNMNIRDLAFEERKQHMMNNTQITEEDVAKQLEESSPATASQQQAEN